MWREIRDDTAHRRVGVLYLCGGGFSAGWRGLRMQGHGRGFRAPDGAVQEEGML